MKVNLNPPLKERNDTWTEETTRQIGHLALTEVRSRKNDEIAFRYYNGLNNKSDFEYLTEAGDRTYPAQLRFFEIIRPKIDIQLSKLSRRPLNYKLIANDSESQREKMKNKLKEYFDIFDIRIQLAKTASIQRIQVMEQQLSQIDQVLANPPQNENEIAIYTELKQIRPQVEMALVALRTHEENVILLLEEEEEKIENFHRYNNMHYVERGGQKYMKKALTEKDVMAKSIKAFRNQWVTGKPLYYVDPNPLNKYPDFEVLNPMFVVWSGGNTSDYIQEQDWATYTVTMTANQIISRFKLSKTDQERIENYSGYSTGTFKTNFNHDAIDSYRHEFNYEYQSEKNLSSSRIDKLIDVTYVYWRSPRKIIRKFTPNKHVEGSFFSHFIDEENEEELSLREGERLEMIYVDDIYQGVLIGSNFEGIVTANGLRPYQVADVDSFKKDLPILGWSFNDPSDEPWSAIWSTKDIQDLVNILRFQQELLVVISGVKGIILDKAQMPDMPEDQWIYDRKMGITWIDSLKKTMGKYPTFNQFTAYDDTMSQSVMWIDQICERLEDFAGRIIGVTRQATGQTVSTDQVGTNRMSIEQSALVSEIVFWRHYHLLGKALTRFMNCAREQGLTDDVISQITSDMGEDIIKLPLDVFDKRNFDCLVINNSNEAQAIDGLRNLAVAERRAGIISLSDMVKIFKSETLDEIESTLEFAGKMAIKRQAEAQKNAEQFQRDHENELKQLELQQKAASDKMKDNIDQLRLQLDEKQVNLEMLQNMEKNRLEEKKLQSDNYLRSQDIALKAVNTQREYENDQFRNRLDALAQQIGSLLEQRKLDIEKIKVNKSNSTKE